MSDKHSKVEKALYKQIHKAVISDKKRKTQTVVSDVIDDNYEAQVDPDMIPHEKANVMNKSKGVKKLKKFMKNRKTMKKDCHSGKK